MLIAMGSEKTGNKEDFNLIVRIFSTDIRGKKTVNIGLCKIRGIDKVFSNAVLSIAKIPKTKLVGKLDETEIKKIEEIIKNPIKARIPEFLCNRPIDPEKGTVRHVVGSDLKLVNDFDIRRMRKIRSYKGIRHALGLKVRGQRTKHYRKGEAAIARKKKVVKK